MKQQRPLLQRHQYCFEMHNVNLLKPSDYFTYRQA